MDNDRDVLLERAEIRRFIYRHLIASKSQPETSEQLNDYAERFDEAGERAWRVAFELELYHARTDAQRWVRDATGWPYRPTPPSWPAEAFIELDAARAAAFRVSRRAVQIATEMKESRAGLASGFPREAMWIIEHATGLRLPDRFAEATSSCESEEFFSRDAETVRAFAVAFRQVADFARWLALELTPPRAEGRPFGAAMTIATAMIETGTTFNLMRVAEQMAAMNIPIGPRKNDELDEAHIWWGRLKKAYSDAKAVAR